MTEKRTTKTCWECEGATMIPLRSLSVKVCADCGNETPWELDPGQPAVLEGGRAYPPTSTRQEEGYL